MPEPAKTIFTLCIGILMGVVPTLIAAWLGRCSEERQIMDAIVHNAVEQHLSRTDGGNNSRHLSADRIYNQLLSILHSMQEPG